MLPRSPLAHRACAVLTAIACFGLPRPSEADDSVPDDGASDDATATLDACATPECALGAVDDPALEPASRLVLLKTARARWPSDRPLLVALAANYLELGNFPWAVRSLEGWRKTHPSDCEAELWLAWTYLQMASLERAAEVLDANTCDEQGALAARRDLLRAFVANTQEQPDAARSAFERAWGAELITASDADAATALGAALFGASPAAIESRVQFDVGYASNALGGSPDDPLLTGRELASPLLELEALVAVTPWPHATVTPRIELEANGIAFTAADAQDVSWLDLGGLVAADARWGETRLSLGYRPEVLYLSGSDRYEDGPIQFYSAHRAEFEADLESWLVLFGGVGRRAFRQAVRSRTELDLGLGGQAHLADDWTLFWGANYRHWFSDGPAYELDGFGATLGLDSQLPLGFSARLSGSLAGDFYPSSAGYFDTDARDELTGRANAALWSPRLDALRVGLGYRFSHRDSSLEAFDYDDHRVELSLRWTVDFDPFAPTRVPDRARPLPWQLESGAGNERLRELLQQDEELQRSSSCISN